MSFNPISHSCGSIDQPFLPQFTPVEEDIWFDEEMLPNSEIADTTTQQTEETDVWDKWEEIKLATTDIQTIVRNIKMPTGEEVMEQVRQTTLSPKSLAQFLDKDF